MPIRTGVDIAGDGRSDGFEILMADALKLPLLIIVP
jgi:hypothetical protein